MFATGCKKDVDLATPERKIVVDAQISPTNDTIKIILEYSKPVNAVSNNWYSSNYLIHDIYNEFAGAEVTLFDGVTVKTLKRDSSEGVFEIAQADFQLVPGKTYQLHVKDSYNCEVSAQTIIPYAVTDAVYTFLSDKPAGSYKNRYTNRYAFTDSLNILHCYRLYSAQKPDNYFNELLYGNYLTEEKSFTGLADIAVETIEPPLFTEDSLAVDKYGYFFSCSYEYFQFYKSFENTKGFSNTPELLEEPVNIYTNI